MCWICGEDLESDHGDSRNITTAKLQVAGNAWGMAIPRAVGSLVQSLSHFDPDRVTPDGTMNDALEELMAEAHVTKSCDTIDDFLTDVWFGSATKEVEEGDAVGLILKSRDEDQFLLMVVYDPHRMPLRGADKAIDIASPEVLEKGCWRFMGHGARGGLNHQPGHEDAIKFVENYIYRGPDWHEDGWPPDVVIKAGTWLAGALLSDATWADYKAGKYGGVSLQGGARRAPASAKSLARVRGGAA